MFVADDHRHFLIRQFVQFLAECCGALRSAYIWRCYHQVVHLQRFYIIGEHNGSIQMIHRDVKESLNLVGMQIYGNDAVCTGLLNHVGYQFCTNRYTGFVLSILTSPAVIRNHGDDLIRTRALGGINHKE